ncbi:hypothetical protein JCM33374_g2102 [Metschnikowia sp. JCM 33374]|nr:hypothetical protein JCM33374_g2102 [Metschnikowia sp. JCM 33374]
MELEEEILSDKIDLAVLQFKAKNYGQCATIYSELVSKLLSLSESRVIKIRRFHGLSDKPVYGKTVHPKLCGILDQRAATYEKLNSQRLALQDAQKIIAVDPVNCKGYLRLGKLHLMDGDRVAAYKIYQQGVFLIQKALEKNNFQVPERLWRQLQMSYRDLNRALKQERASVGSQSGSKVKSPSESTSKPSTARAKTISPNYSRGLQGQLDRMLPLKRTTTEPIVPSKRPRSSRDIFNVFPKEVIEIIFALIPFRDVLRAHLVCKTWYETLTSLPRLYQNSFILKHRVTTPEYLHGLKLMKKVSEYSFSRSINLLSVWSTLNTHHLGKIIESVISDGSLKLSRLNLLEKGLSMELIFQKLEKCKWDYSSLSSVRHLRMGINSSLYHGKVLFNIFPDLESLELLCLDSMSRKSNMSLIPSFSDKYHQFVNDANSIKHQTTIKRLVLINHPLLKREHQHMRPGQMSFEPKPPFLGVSFPSLTELKITSHDFSGVAVELQSFLREATSLKEIYLENNDELSLKKFLLLLSSCSPKFKLTRFTLRESHQDGSFNIDEVVADDLECLHGLSHLDIYGSCISSTGLLKFLTIVNKEGRLSSLNIGHSSYVQFKNDNFVTGTAVLKFSQLFELAPNVEVLQVPELNLDNLSMRLLREDLGKSYTGRNGGPKLKHLDLSFCHSIDGIGLMNLFRGSSRDSDLLQMSFETLTLDGMHFNVDTLQLIKKKGYVKSIQNDPFKKKWKSYGINSFVLETD